MSNSSAFQFFPVMTTVTPLGYLTFPLSYRHVPNSSVPDKIPHAQHTRVSQIFLPHPTDLPPSAEMCHTYFKHTHTHVSYVAKLNFIAKIVQNCD